VPREAHLVADLGGLLLDPRIGRVGQHLAADEGVDAAGFEQRHLLGVAQVGVWFVLHHGGLALHRGLEHSAQRVGLDLARLVGLGDDGRRGLHAPTHGLKDLLQVGSGEFDFQFAERGVHAVAEDVVVRKQRVPQRGAQLGGNFDEAAVALPGDWVPEFALLLFWQAFCGRFVGRLGRVRLVGPVGQKLLDLAGDGAEARKQLVAQLLVERGADVLVAGGEAQRLDGIERELAVQAQRPLNRNLPVAEGSVGEYLRLGCFLKVEEDAADALDVLGRQFAVLLAEVLAQRLEPLRGVDELHPALAVRWLLVGQHPDVGGDAGVVEEVERQCDDGFEPVILDDPAADVALALTRVTREQRRAVVYLGDTTSKC